MADLKPYCPVCGNEDSLPEPAKGTCAHCYNHMVTDAPSHPAPVQTEQSLRTVGYLYSDGFGTHYTEDVREVLDGYGIESHTTLVDRTQATAALAQKDAEIAALQDVVTGAYKIIDRLRAQLAEADRAPRFAVDGSGCAAGVELCPCAEAIADDAARYRYLRERDLATIYQGGVFAGMTPDNVILNGDDLDAAIDADLSSQQEGEK